MARFEGDWQLQELIAMDKIALITGRGGYMEHSYVEQGEKLHRRQDLPATAMCPRAEAASSTVCDGGAVAISHGWLVQQHPDPLAQRREAMRSVLRTNGSRKLFIGQS